jgi:hypothetical protein
MTTSLSYLHSNDRYNMENRKIILHFVIVKELFNKIPNYYCESTSIGDDFLFRTCSAHDICHMPRILFVMLDTTHAHVSCLQSFLYRADSNSDNGLIIF